MSAERLPVNDPRTLARDIPGILDSLFPQLVPGVVAHFNRQGRVVPGCKRVPQALIEASKLQRAMLFEIAVAAGEQLVGGVGCVDWVACLDVAVARQRRHFDARVPESLTETDKLAAIAVGQNLAAMLVHIAGSSPGGVLTRSPQIPGYQWIASGLGDFAVGKRLIEVKCTNRHFSSADYRQTIMYWLLAYACAVEGGPREWSNVVLLNPRLNFVVEMSFNDVLAITGAGRSKVELLQLFSSMVGDRAQQRTAHT